LIPLIIWLSVRSVFANYKRNVGLVSEQDLASWHKSFLATALGHQDNLMHAEFSPDGQKFVTASADHTARIWASLDGKLLLELKGHTGPIWDAVFSPQGDLIVTASVDQTARVWNATNGDLLTILQGHENIVESAAFERDGQAIVTASADRTARVYRLITIPDISKLLSR
jgi:WD40 repeat protein